MAVREIAQTFLAADNPEDVYRFALERVSPLAGALFSCVYTLEPDAETMRLAAAHNWPERYARFLNEMRVRVGAGPSGLAVAERRVVEVADILADRTLSDWRDVADELGFRSLIALPLETGDVVHGAITFYFAERETASPETLHLLRTVADQMAATAQKARLIVDLRRANGALEESNTALERQFAALLEARRVKDEFLSNISHELRTPLTAVIGYIALMQEGVAGPVTDDQQETLSQVKASSEHLRALIGDLLDLTTLRRGELELNMDDFAPDAPLRDAARAIPRATDAVLVEIGEFAGAESMRSDRAKLSKILTILLGNAIKFTPKGSVHASVRVKADRAIYEVRDTGIGIPRDAQQLIFEEFRQVDGTATRRYGGAGLGLALARRLARFLGGDISVSSVPDVGSTFTVDLPLTHAKRDALARVVAPAPAVGRIPDHASETRA